MLLTLFGGALAIVLLYWLLGFTPLSLPFLLVIFVIVGLYFFAAEMTKRWFYRTLREE